MPEILVHVLDVLLVDGRVVEGVVRAGVVEAGLEKPVLSREVPLRASFLVKLGPAQAGLVIAVPGMGPSRLGR
jgi:hypothetical protein